MGLDEPSELGKKASPSRVQKLDENLFFAPFSEAGAKLLFVLERVTQDNREGWQQYGLIQSSPRVVQAANNKAMALGQKFTNAGSSYFKRVLDEVPIENNEVWIAYITRNTNPMHANFWNYNAEKVSKLNEFVYNNRENPEKLRDYLKDKFAENILMFVTVASSPQAKIMSPMGISRSAESFCIGDTLGKENLKGLSPHLLSFAAQALLLQNSNLEYLVNTPVPVMAGILSKRLPPNSLFVGTKTDYESSKDLRDKITFWEAKYGHNPHPSFEEFKEHHLPLKEHDIEALSSQEAMQCVEEEEEEINEEVKRRMKEEEGSSLIKIQKEFIADTEIPSFIYKDSRGGERRFKNPFFNIGVEIKEDRVHYTPAYRQARFETLKKSLSEDLWKKLYTETHPPHPAQNLQGIEWIRFMMNYPPILEVTKDSLKIYEAPGSNDVILEIKKNDPAYDWIFRDLYSPSINTKYIAVNIKALAGIFP